MIEFDGTDDYITLPDRPEDGFSAVKRVSDGLHLASVYLNNLVLSWTD